MATILTNFTGANVAIRSIPEAVSDFFMIFNLLIWGEVIGFLGIAANIINIRIFIKEGYKETVNVTLTALAVSDIGALLTMQVTNIMTNSWFQRARLPFRSTDIVKLFSFYPHNYFIRVSGLITAVAALERCLCVMYPLKVKTMVTTKRILVIVIGIFVVTTLNVFTPYYYSFLGWTTLANNFSYLQISFRENANFAFGISYFITDLFVPYFTFAVLIFCNVFIAVKLISKGKWRRSVTVAKSNGSVTVKETKVVRMLAVLSAIFIVCLFPQSAILTAVALYIELSVYGAYFDVALLCYCMAYFMETLYSSVNILVYYKMSSKYRDNFHLLFGKKICCFQLVETNKEHK